MKKNIILVLLTLTTIGISGCLPNDPTKLLNEYSKAIASGNCEKMNKYYNKLEKMRSEGELTIEETIQFGAYAFTHKLGCPQNN